MSSGLGLPLPGVLAEYRVFPSSGLVACPAYLTDEEACTLPIAAVTAWMSINWQQPIGSPFQHAVQGSEKPVVLLQGTGGVSISGLQIATALGFSTIVTSSSDVKLARAKEMGATYTINYKSTPNWHEEVMSLTSKRGASIILETGGASTLRKSFACIAFGGCISCVGYLGGKEDEAGKQTNVNVLALMRNVTLHGILNGPRDRFEEMLGLYERREIRPVVDRVFEFGEAKEALEHLFAGRHFGKVVVKVA
jgi:NADPH:quinone reductase-like Zn-dependent oxidoreductase